MPDLSVNCPACKSRVTVAEAFVPKMTGQTRPCPVCDSPLRFPNLAVSAMPASPSTTPAPVPAPPSKPGKPVRLTCPHCSAQFTLSYDAASKIAGSNMKCLKCDADIPVPSFEAAAPVSPTPAPLSSAPQPPPPDVSGDAPTRRKCTGCLSAIEEDVTYCPICGTRMDDRKSTQPTGTGARLRVRKEEEAPATVPCLKCKRPIDPEMVICPHCKTNQRSGRKNKPDTRPIGWNQDPVKHSTTGKIVHKIGMVFFAAILLALMTAGGFWLYKFILSQFPK